MERVELNSMTLEETRELMKTMGIESYRGEQIFTHFNKHRKSDITSLNLLPLKLRRTLEETTKVREISIYKKFESKLDSTKKYLFLLEDNNIIESVLMEYKHGYTACVSTQVGCKMACVFCASTKEGLVRNLSPAEILNQIYMMEKDLNVEISNIVLMGSGEPLDNYDNVLNFLKIIHEEKGHGMSYRNMTLSTCGLVAGIYALAKENIPITLSVSLHSAFDEGRKKIMPIALRYGLKELIEACSFYVNETGRRITFEYTVIEGVNDRKEDIVELAKLLKDLKCHVNLIALNPIEEYSEGRPSRASIEYMKKSLENNKIPATIRREMGSDISASCGQLRRSLSPNDKEENGVIQ